MKRVLLAAMVLSCALAVAAEPPADLVLLNGGIFTAEGAQPWVQALAVQGETIVATGTSADIRRYIGPGTRVVDLAGRMALPGFHDSHIHTISGGYGLRGCMLDADSIEESIRQLQACAEHMPDGVLYAQGVDQTLFPGGLMYKETLDAAFPDRSVVVTPPDGHSVWVNSKTLALAGIERDTPDPANGEIVRDPATGEAIGTLRETAGELVEPLLPQRNPADDLAALATAQDYLLGVGVTSVSDIARSTRDWAAWQSFERSGAMKLKVRSALVYQDFADYPAGEFKAQWAMRGEYASARLDTNSVKIYLDGVLEGETAAVLEPYLVTSPHRGKLMQDQAALDTLLTRLDAEGTQVVMHAIGDGATRAGLDAVAAARAANGPGDNRHHITHLQLIHPDDIPRFAVLDVAANFQALWAFPDTWIMDLNLPVVGMQRVQRMYPLGSVHRSGGRIAGSSDWDVSSANPLDAIEVAVRRQDADATEGAVLNAAERMQLGDMLRAYTANGAFLMHHERSTGTLSPAMQADIVVLDRNLFEGPATEINEALVVITVINGEVVYSASPTSESE
jgi:predicted amidohydrolase YtcJ